jgi:transcriptional regulator with GAF, ATPase, and Fis domain
VQGSSETVDIHQSALTGSVAAKLVVVAGPDEGLEVPLAGTVEIGTDPSCGVVLHDPSVSRRHVAVRLEEGRIEVKDLGSRNGTFLGEARLVSADVPLGAVLRIGKSQVGIHARWRLREVSPSTARHFGGLIGESVSIREVFAILERVAPTNVIVLIDGESGTGKELAARSVHDASAQRSGPYVVFDCGSVPSELAESELFGHKRGAFSGAVSDRAGAFQRAHGGTLCLDEIGELPIELQPKLLRVLETGEVRSVGDDAPRKVDVRIVAATNRDLYAEARRGRFRSDLLYRLEVVRVRLPPLRHRPEDIPGLVRHLLAGKLPEDDAIDGENLDRLLGYSWPGNVRELRNALARAVTLGNRPGELKVAFARLVFNLGPAASAPATIGPSFPGTTNHVPYKEAKAQLLDSFDRAYVSALLERHKNNVSKAAAAAGLSRKHLYELIRRVTGDGGEGPQEGH